MDAVLQSMEEELSNNEGYDDEVPGSCLALSRWHSKLVLNFVLYALTGQYTVGQYVHSLLYIVSSEVPVVKVPPKKRRKTAATTVRPFTVDVYYLHYFPAILGC